MLLLHSQRFLVAYLAECCCFSGFQDFNSTYLACAVRAIASTSCRDLPPPFSISGSALELVWVFLEPVPNTTVLTLMVFRCFPSCSSVIDHLCYACHWHVFVLVVCILCFASVFKPAALASCTILLLYHLPLLYYILLWLLHSNCLITLLG